MKNTFSFQTKQKHQLHSSENSVSFSFLLTTIQIKSSMIRPFNYKDIIIWKTTKAFYG